MILDIIKIGQIKKKSQLKKYNLNKPIFNMSYLFHYLIITNNLRGLKLAYFPVNIVNNDNYNGFMLAAIYNNYKILEYLIKTYPQFIYVKNSNNMNFLHFLSPTDIMYYDMIKKNTNIKWNELFKCYSILHISPLDILFINGYYNIITKVIKYINFDYSIYQSEPAFFNLFNNINLKSKSELKSAQYIINILNIMYMKDNMIFTYIDDSGYDISFYIILRHNINLVKYIVDMCKESIDKYSPIFSNNIFTIAYNFGLKNNDMTIANLIYNKTMQHHNYEETDVKGNNIAHMILLSHISNKRGDYNLEKSILSQIKDWSKMNIDKETLLDLITKLDFKIYHKFVKQINNITIKSIKKITDIKWKKYLMKLPKSDTKKTKIIMLDAPYTHSNMYQARFTDIAIFCFYLKNKYKNLYLPQYYGKHKVHWNNDIILPENLLEDYNNFPWLIIWNNNTTFWIHPNLNNLINEHKNKYDYAFVILSLRINDGLHATLIFYDFKRNIVERFDPYGNTTVMDRDMDNILDEELTWNTGLKYIAPSVYFPVSGFQTISDELNLINIKLGDFGGYCLAWCFWYVEHRMLNSKIDPIILVRKTLNRFMEMNIKPSEYIRNYANKININRFKFYKKHNISENIVSDENIKLGDKLKLFKAIIKTNELIK